MKNLQTRASQICWISFLLFGSIILTSATAQATGVALTATPDTSTVTVGQTATYTININRTVYADKVTLSATGLPAGVTATFTPNVTTASASTLKLQTAAQAPVGTFNISVKATAPGVTIAPLIIKLIIKAASAVTIKATPAALGIITGHTASIDITITRTNFDGAVNLSALKIPEGVEAWFVPQTTTGNSARMYLRSNIQSPRRFYMGLRAATAAENLGHYVELLIEENCGLEWARQFTSKHVGGAPNGTCSNGQTGCAERATDVAVDGAGNVFVVGTVDSNVVNTVNESWIAKYDSSGTKLWIRYLYGPHRYATDVITDLAGNVYVAGYYLRPINRPDVDIFVRRYDANGNNPIEHGFGTFYEDGTGAIHLAFNPAGNLILHADANNRTFEEFGGTVQHYDIRRYHFGTNFSFPTETVLGSYRNYHPFLYPPSDIDVNSSGVVAFSTGLMVVKLGAQSWETTNAYGKHIAVDSNGNVFVTDGGRIQKLNAVSGQEEWRYREAGGTTINALMVDANNDVYYAGETRGSITTPNLDGKPDGFWRKISGVNAMTMLVRQFPAHDGDGFHAIAPTDNEVYLAGYTFNFNNVNYDFQDNLLIKDSIKFCLQPGQP